MISDPEDAAPTAAEAQARARRLENDVDAAQRLIAFAAANGKPVPDEVRDDLIDVAATVSLGAATVSDEKRFFKAYEALAIRLAPVTAATLAASQTQFPALTTLLFDRVRFVREARSMTLGRFAHFLIFVLVLCIAGVGLAYQSIGASEIARYRELDGMITASQSGGEAGTTTGKVGVAQWEVERDALPTSLRDWEERPCGIWWSQWLCIFKDQSAMGTPAGPSSASMVFAAQAALDRINQIVLPLLLGLLGAYSFVLRSMSLEIRALTFAPNSSLQHLVRLSLGALAGIASGWLLKPEQIGLLASVPAWTLAFVAGYGSELVFAFMDRLIAAFTEPKAP